jgi:diadenosine tetraphosphate (Ap4A) HIT family hydrolase
METSLFTAVPCRDCDVPGYVILIPKSSGSSLKDLSSDTQSQFGPALAKVEAAIKSVTGADRVYIMRFSEAMESVHFHLFPRTSEWANAFRKELPSDEPGINGPMLFAWARKKFYVPSPTRLSPHTLEVATKISAYLKSENR